MKTNTPIEILPGALYTQQETMDYLRISWKAFTGILRRQELRFSWVGRRRRFLGQDILDYVDPPEIVTEEPPKAAPKNGTNRRRKTSMSATEQALENLRAKGAYK